MSKSSDLNLRPEHEKHHSPLSSHHIFTSTKKIYLELCRPSGQYPAIYLVFPCSRRNHPHFPFPSILTSFLLSMPNQRFDEHNCFLLCTSLTALSLHSIPFRNPLNVMLFILYQISTIRVQYSTDSKYRKHLTSSPDLALDVIHP